MKDKSKQNMLIKTFENKSNITSSSAYSARSIHNRAGIFIADHYKKFFSLLISLLISSKIFALGIGPVLDFTAGNDFKNSAFTAMIVEAGISCSIKADNIPFSLNIATDWNFSENIFKAKATCDYWIFNPQISDYTQFFSGLGAAAGLSACKNSAAFTAAPRLVIGLNWIFYDGFLEYFIQGAAEPEFSFGNGNNFSLKFPCNAGIRLYF